MNRRGVLKGVGGLLACAVAPLRSLYASADTENVALPATLTWEQRGVAPRAFIASYHSRNATAWRGTAKGLARITGYEGYRTADGAWVMTCRVEPFDPSEWRIAIADHSGFHFPDFHKFVDRIYPFCDFDAAIPPHARKIG